MLEGSLEGGGGGGEGGVRESPPPPYGIQLFWCRSNTINIYHI